MRSFILSLAAVAALGLVAPYAAPAKAEETVVVRHGDHGWRHHRTTTKSLSSSITVTTTEHGRKQNQICSSACVKHAPGAEPGSCCTVDCTAATLSTERPVSPT